MAVPPPAKKQKTDGSKPPIVFKHPGVSKPDVCLTVFEQEFHVHSVLLKLHSAFFRKFLDSPDKVDMASRRGFKYEWVTAVDTDGTWHLEALCNHKQQTEMAEFKNHPSSETGAFQNLLCAFYVQPYKIAHRHQLNRMTELADYYCALPILSKTLSGAFPLSNSFVHRIQYFAHEILPIAAKLRHAVLFKECVVFLAAQWREDLSKIDQVKDLKLRKIVRNAFNEIAAKVARVQSLILNQICYKPESSSARAIASMKDGWVGFEESERGVMPLPQVLSSLYGSGAFGDSEKEIEDLLDDLVGGNSNRSVLVYPNGGQQYLVYEDGFETFFFCAEVADEDLPWDITEVDW